MKQLILIAGLPGTGKSTLAKALAERLSFVWVRSDDVRSSLFGDATQPKEGEQKLYPAEQSALSYKAMALIARHVLQCGKGVVLDATFNSEKHRKLARDTAAASGAGFHIVHCVCDEETVKRRMSQRLSKQNATGYKIANFDLHLAMKKVFEPFKDKAITADLSAPLEEMPKVAERIVGEILDSYTQGRYYSAQNELE